MGQITSLFSIAKYQKHSTRVKCSTLTVFTLDLIIIYGTLIYLFGFCLKDKKSKKNKTKPNLVKLQADLGRAQPQLALSIVCKIIDVPYLSYFVLKVLFSYHILSQVLSQALPSLSLYSSLQLVSQSWKTF